MSSDFLKIQYEAGATALPERALPCFRGIGTKTSICAGQRRRCSSGRRREAACLFRSVTEVLPERGMALAHHPASACQEGPTKAMMAPSRGL
jgi:hypothetical protein